MVHGNGVGVSIWEGEMDWEGVGVVGVHRVLKRCKLEKLVLTVSQTHLR